MPGKRTQWILALGILIGVVLAASQIHASLNTGTRPALRLEVSGGFGLAEDSGILAFKDAVWRAFQAPGQSRGGRGSGDLKAAFGRQTDQMHRFSDIVVQGGQAALAARLEDIRAELQAQAERQLKEYGTQLESRHEVERLRLKNEQRTELERFSETLEAQYAPMLMNLQMRLQSVGLAERQEIQQQISAINTEIRNQVIEREKSHALELDKLIGIQNDRFKELVKEQELQLKRWISSEYQRLESQLRADLDAQNARQKLSIQAGIRRRLNETAGASEGGKENN